ncbi:MAG TPA: GspH/FimT family pseudopilin [Longimicrobiaceae bacterium]|nr:GspH/FimT family pseudopilin [Longimicrobiaceae bacterium]
MRRLGRGGFTLTELLVVMTIVVVSCALAIPSVTGMMASYRVRGAAMQLSGHLFYARMLAVKSGHPVSVRVVPDARCTPGPRADVAGTSYVIVLRTQPVREVRTVASGSGGVGACLESNRSDSIGFDSRGLLRPVGNRTVWLSSGPIRDSISISVAGRVLRRF